MAGFNKVILMGNLTRDPELTYLPQSNTPSVEIGMAVNRRFRRQDGEQGEEVLFVDCRAYGRQAEVLNEYCRKGRPLFLEGRLKLEQWKGQDGSNRSKIRVIIENFQFIGSRDGDGGGGGGGDGGSGSNYRGGGRGAPSHASAGPPADGPPQTGDHAAPGEDDIPF
ncbi:MAG: single-stranded DNA-binding protein [Planctomycetaceae bacterium]|nr:single-stranded DNA-binding protein [Planctomycetaceae bacterium]